MSLNDYYHHIRSFLYETIVINSWLFIRALVQSYVFTANKNFGGFGGAEEWDICRDLSNAPSSHWAKPNNAEDCSIYIAKHIDGITMTTCVVLFSLFFIGYIYCFKYISIFIVKVFQLLGSSKTKPTKDYTAINVKRHKTTQLNDRNKRLRVLFLQMLEQGRSARDPAVQEFVGSFQTSVNLILNEEQDGDNINLEIDS